MQTSGVDFVTSLLPTIIPVKLMSLKVVPRDQGFRNKMILRKKKPQLQLHPGRDGIVTFVTVTTALAGT